MKPNTKHVNWNNIITIMSISTKIIELPIRGNRGFVSKYTSHN